MATPEHLVPPLERAGTMSTRVYSFGHHWVDMAIAFLAGFVLGSVIEAVYAVAHGWRP